MVIYGKGQLLSWLLHSQGEKMNHDINLAFIGGGNMAQALGNGLIGRFCPAANVHVIDPNQDIQKTWHDLGASTANSADEKLQQCNIWFFAIKPQIMAQVVQQCSTWLQPNTLIISIAAGIPSSALANWLGKNGDIYTKIVRCMPNTPALIANGMTGMTALAGVNEADKQLAEQMLSAVGDVLWVADDNAIDAVTSISGSGPAYVFLFLDALISAGVNQGLSQSDARKLALKTMQGATELANISPDSPAALRQKVTSKGGTTAAAVAQFEQHDFAAIVNSAVSAAAKRAAELAKEFS